MDPLEYTYTLVPGGPNFIIPTEDQLTGNVEVERNPGMCRHYAFLFNMYVLLQIFNEINSRKLGDQEYNVFKGFFNNGLFLGIIVGTLLVQTALVEYGGAAVRTIPLTLEQHLICLAIGFFSLINGVITKKLLKPEWFAWIRIKEDATPEEAEKSLSRMIRQPSRIGNASKKQIQSNVSTHPGKSGLKEPLLVSAINN
jgi:Ca2+ transporting ATPase